MKTEMGRSAGRAPAVPADTVTAPEPGVTSQSQRETAFGQPRSFLDNRFVYAVISQRARGLSIGVNLNPDKRCNFDCVYCEIDREQAGPERFVDVRAMARELEHLLSLATAGQLGQIPWFRHFPAELLQLKEVALSGDGEPTLCPNFAAVVRQVLHIRSRGRVPFFKVVLITNGTALDLPEVRRGVKLLSKQDDIWVKLDVGTQQYMDAVNRPEVPLWMVLSNILALAKQRPVVIQSLFPLIDGQEPSTEDIEQYVQRLRELRAAGAQISLVQVYSAHRPPHRPNCEHLPLKTLSGIARRVREATGLKAEVF